jgi:hypothetical protein
MAIRPSERYVLSYQDQELWERGDLSLKGVKAALARRDPRLAEYIVKLVQLDPALPEEEAKQYKGTFGYSELISELGPWRRWQALSSRCEAVGLSLEAGEIDRNKLREVIAEMHRELWLKVEETPDAMPDRLKLGDVLMGMWESRDAFSRTSLLKMMSELPLKYGPWRAMKKIFKESIVKQDWVMFGVIAARLDREGGTLPGSVRYMSPNKPFRVPYSYDNRDVSRATVQYLLRRAWRAMRVVAQEQPSLYPEVAAQVLKHYRSNESNWQLSSSWLRNHILFHECKRYGAESFYYNPRSDFGEQAYTELWKRSEVPLLRLLEEASNGRVIGFVTEALLEDFRAVLAKLDATWVKRVARLSESIKDGFLHKWYTELCPHAQRDFVAQGLHEPLLTLLWSSKREMSEYALTYFQAHPEALLSLISIDTAIALARSPQEHLRQLGESILNPSAGHFTLSLEQWTTLLKDERSFKFAAEHVKKLFSGKDLSYDWYIELINHELDALSTWAMALLKDSAYQPLEGDLFAFYWSLLTPASWRSNSSKTALEGLAEPSSSDDKAKEGRLLEQLSAAQVRALMLHPETGGRAALKAWVKEGWISPTPMGARWLRDLLDRDLWRSGAWREALADEGKEWRDDLDYPDDASSLAQDWLLTPKHFGVDDLGAWWLLQRGLDSSWSMRAYRQYVERYFPIAYFVALDASAEDEVPESPSASDGLASILNALDAPRRSWSDRNQLREIFRKRVPALVLASDPNASKLASKLAIGDQLLNFEVFTQLAFSTDEDNRSLARTLGEQCYQRWTQESPLNFAKLLPFFAKGFADIQDHLLKAMSAAPRSAEARIDVRLEQFEPDGLYSFCFSSKAQVRDLGLSLISEHPERFADPERISLLVESSDRRVCEGVVKILWEKLRFQAATESWRPHPQSVSPRSAVAQRQAEVISARPPAGKHPEDIKGKRYIGEGVVAQTPLPTSSLDWVADFLTRTLFRLSPTHPLKGDLGRLTEATPGWRNKVNLIKALRDLAVTDQEFANLIKPILEEFMRSRGRSERAACLVALTRMRAAHPSLFSASFDEPAAHL